MSHWVTQHWPNMFCRMVKTFKIFVPGVQGIALSLLSDRINCIALNILLWAQVFLKHITLLWKHTQLVRNNLLLNSQSDILGALYFNTYYDLRHTIIKSQYIEMESWKLSINTTLFSIHGKLKTYILMYHCSLTGRKS